MRPFLLFLTAISLLAGGCGDDGPTTPDQPQDVRLGDETIGAAGGTLEGEGFQLTVPEGAFDTDYELTLYLSSNDHGFGDDRLTKVYAVDGFPLFNLEPLWVSLEMESTPMDSALMALGRESLDPTTGNSEYTYNYYPAGESLSYLVCVLPAAGEEG